MALNKYLIPNWPFKGEVLLIEQSRDSGLVEKHTINNWAHVNYEIIGQSEVADYHLSPSKTFDHDTFQILRKHISKPAPELTIVTQK
jgi:hypothetical protein